MVEEVRDDVPTLEQVLVPRQPGVDRPQRQRPGRHAAGGDDDWSLSPDDPINIQYTSGTTGYPKGATLSHRNILNNGYLTTELINFTHEDRLCIPVPFYHCFGMVMGNLGCTSPRRHDGHPGARLRPRGHAPRIAEEKCTGVYGVPTMFIAMQNHPTFADHDLSSLRTGIMAGSICPVEVMKRCINDMHMPEVAIAYGMTETSPVSCQTRDDDDLDRRTASIGRVHPHLEIKIVDPATGETVERGQPGEYCTRGYSVMLGYWEDPEKTAEAIDADGWMHTGDLAEMRDDGYCNIVGRIKDMVIRGGENIYPSEIEEFLYQHPDIEDVQVIGVPDEKYGEELCAWIKMRAGAEPLDADAVREFCAGRLSHYKIPRYVMVVEEFPMTVTGKIRKVAMREESIKVLERAMSVRADRGPGAEKGCPQEFNDRALRILVWKSTSGPRQNRRRSQAQTNDQHVCRGSSVEKHVHFEQRDKVGYILLSNPPANRVGKQYAEDLRETITKAGSSGARCLVVRAEGDDFSLGGVMQEWRDRSIRLVPHVHR